MRGKLSIFPEDNLCASEDYSILYLKVYEQLKKDFHPHVAIAEKPKSIDAEWLRQEVKRMLSEIVQAKPQALGFIINRVDLSEFQMKKFLHNSSEMRRLQQLSEVILRREALKVWIRQNLSK